MINEIFKRIDQGDMKGAYKEIIKTSKNENNPKVKEALLILAIATKENWSEYLKSAEEKFFIK